MKPQISSFGFSHSSVRHPVKYKLILNATITILICFISISSFAQVTEHWVKKYNGTGNSDDMPYAMKIDNSGNVIVTGKSKGSGTGYDYVVIKYNSYGNVVWTQRYNAPGNNDDIPIALQVDATGNVYVTGGSIGNSSDFDYLTIKYSSSGIQQWTNRYNGPGNQKDWPNSIAVDISGNAYVTGSSTGTGTGRDFATIKYNSSGVQQWVQRFNGPVSADDYATQIGVDGFGNVYVTGGGIGAGASTDYATIKYSSAGVQQWVKRYERVFGSTDMATSMVVDFSGNVYVSGRSYHDGYVTIKYNSAGDQQWLQSYPFTGYTTEWSNSLNVDASGNVYVAGGSLSGPIRDYVLIKYSSLGFQQWVQTYNGPGNGQDIASSINIDGTGNVYVTGKSKGTGSSLDYATIKYNSSGVQQWIERYNGAANGNDIPVAVCTDNQGNYYVTGRSWNGYNFDITSVKYSEQTNLSLLINYPAGGEVIEANYPGSDPRTLDINWTALWGSSSAPENYRVELFVDNNPAPWYSQIVPSTSNIYRLTLPYTSLSQCRVKVSNATNPNQSNISNPFSIVENSGNYLLKFKIKGENLSAKKFSLKSGNLVLKKKDIQNNECGFTKSELAVLLTNNSLISDIEILGRNQLNNTDTLIGHIKFEYDAENFRNGKKVDAIVYIDNKTAYEVGFDGRSISQNDWDYFEKSSEKLLYMLIPPNESFAGVRTTFQPVLFVHGIYGRYPYHWGDKPRELYSQFDTWQFYYPYDMEIHDCSELLTKSIDNILSGDPTGSSYPPNRKINVIAHSMGGLVSREYIQTSMGDPKINKLMMLGTPNNGSLASFRVRNGTLIGIIAEWLDKDPKSPAHIDMTPASEKLVSLKGEAPKPLNGRRVDQSYLVVAGTRQNFTTSLANLESFLQDDGVVAVSSASMLEKDVPLATIPASHNEIPAQLSGTVIQNFFNDNYDPNIITYMSGILQNVRGFFSSGPINQPDNSIIKEKGTLSFSISGVESHNYIDLFRENQNNYFLEFRSYPDFRRPQYLERNPEAEDNYFVRNNTEGASPLFDPIGVSIYTSEQGIFRLKYRRWYNDGQYSTITPNPNNFIFKNLQNNLIVLTPDPQTLHFLNAKTSAEARNIADGDPGQRSFNIDPSIDTFAICLNGQIGDTAFAENSFKLFDPDNNAIDSTIANLDPDIVFEQSINDAFVYYYIVNPQPGNWIADFNPNIAEPSLTIPIQSSVIYQVQFSDSSYVAGDTVEFSTILPKSMNIRQIQLSANLTLTKEDSSAVLNLGPLMINRVNDSTYQGRFFTRATGSYRLNATLNCLYEGQPIQRTSSNSILINRFSKPVTLFPKNDSLNVPETARFFWNRNLNANKYELELYKIGDSVASYRMFGLSDTSCQISGLLKQMTYFWQVRSYDSRDTSEWSFLKQFTTIPNQPDSIFLSGPPNNAAGLYAPVHMKWKRNISASSYQCQISISPDFSGSLVVDSLVRDTVLAIYSLGFPQMYYWRARALNEGGTGPFSEIRTLYTEVPPNLSLFKVKLVPQGFLNPVTNKLKIADTVKAFLVNSFSPFSLVDSAKSLLDSVSLEATFNFVNAPSGLYMIRIIHRNSIETWSKSGGEPFTRYGISYYDFTASRNRAYGDNQVQVGTKWCIYSGDVNQDGTIDGTDAQLIDNDAGLFVSGYVNTDVNGDGTVDGSDAVIAGNNSDNFISKIVP
jgi:pimeloyl-ACP methyl ester carboxylesterase